MYINRGAENYSVVAINYTFNWRLNEDKINGNTVAIR